MGVSLLDEFNVRPHLNAYWLRPESALWDCIAARELGRVLHGADDVAEIGIGNGFFSFLLFGGQFKPEFDWFYSVDTDGFWQNKDIFDHDKGIALDRFIAKAPDMRLALALDHKQTLLNQAARLGFVDKLQQHDCNLPLPITRTHKTAYSNMLYWLDDPIAAINNIAKMLPEGGELVTVFPNSAFYESCQSYIKRDPLSVLLNRGRADHIMWHMDLPDFSKRIEADGLFEVKLATRYLSPMTLKIWDIGLRPLSVPLIKMANALTPETRMDIKQEWCETLEQFYVPVLQNELENGRRDGGYNLVVLTRK